VQYLGQQIDACSGDGVASRWNRPEPSIRLRRVANNDEPSIGCCADELMDTQAE
jgi:hypothetical protein